MNQLVRRVDRTLANQLKDIILEQISAGKLRPGGKIPSERELTKLYGVSRATARNTILALANEGLVTRAVGSGTYVAAGVDLSAASASETGTIGLLVGRQHVPVRSIQDDFYYYKVMEGIQGELRASRRHLLFSYLDDDERENKEIVAGLQGKVDGVLLAEASSNSLVGEIHERGLPCVLINPSIDDIDQRFDSLSVNNRSGAHKAIAYLIGIGHRRIGCLRGPAASLAAQDRFDGYLKALAEKGTPHDENLVVPLDGWTMNDGAAGIQTLMARAPDITAVFCASDTLAIGAMAGVKGRRKIPEQLSVVGFDDISLSSHSVPPLTTVHSPTFDLGKQAGRQLLNRIRNRSLLVTRVLLSPELKVRESCSEIP
jgi:LacI family transcriptional regulator